MIALIRRRRAAHLIHQCWCDVRAAEAAYRDDPTPVRAVVVLHCRRALYRALEDLP